MYNNQCENQTSFSAIVMFLSFFPMFYVFLFISMSETTDGYQHCPKSSVITVIYCTFMNTHWLIQIIEIGDLKIKIW